jgi:hypothetical protein
MDERGSGPRTGDIIGGVVLIFFGLCILLVGGGCAIFWIALMFNQSSYGASDGAGLLVLSLAAAAAGLFAIVMGVRMFMKKRG